MSSSNIIVGTDNNKLKATNSETDNSGDINGEAKTKDWSPKTKMFLESLRPQMLNLMNEFADAEMFLIDGDSLLVELLTNKNLDWCYGGQFLHLVYLCERYLHFFQRKGGVFQLIFFQDYQKLWEWNPSLSLARQILKIHLSENVKNKVLCDFKNPCDPKFLTYVQQFCPSFILLSDGDFHDRLSSQFSFPNYSIFSKVFVSQLNKFLTLDINCAFTAAIEFDTSTLNGYHVSSHNRFHPLQQDKTILNDTRSCNENSKIHIVPDFKSILSDIIKAVDILNTQCDNSKNDCRFLLHLAAASVYLNEVSKDKYVHHHLDLVRVVFLHAVLLTELPLTYRAFSFDDNDIDKDPDIQNYFMQCFTKLQYFMFKFLEFTLPDNCGLNWSKVYILDVWDGRLLFTLFDLLLKNKSNGKEVSLSSRAQSKYIALINSVSSLSKLKIDPFPILTSLAHEDNSKHVQNSQSILQVSKHLSLAKNTVPEKLEGLIKIDCPLLNEYAGEILNTASLRRLGQDEPGVADIVDDFDEKYHWHSGKPLSDDYERTGENKVEGNDKRRELRSQAKFATFMHRYGESLQGERCVKPIIIEKVDKHMKKKKATRSQKALKIIEENNRKKEEEMSNEEERKWAEKQLDLKDMITEKNYNKVLFYLNNLVSRFSFEKTKIKVLMMKAKILWEKWQQTCKSEDEITNTTDVESCFLTIRELVEDYGESLEKKQKVALAKYLDGFGFGDISMKTSLTNSSALKKTSNLKVSSSKPNSNVKTKRESGEFSLHVSSSRFQLQNIGHQLKRETRSDPDPRVDNFIPETWQRELLDAVDNKQSALIVAPTSSGKTYASYYCMESILKEDNDGVVVYVSPTKALVNQVAASCYARFHKKQMPPEKSVCGVFTRDYRTNALNSQILVTVPQCLEILLLSPARQDWVAKIRYVIFDEVHCLGAEIGAEYWEHLLLLIRCPFLALSATIRNPEDLHTWLQIAESQKQERDKKNNSVRQNSPKSYKVALVTYNNRYNDLEKFNYDNQTGLQHVHPCSLLTYRQLSKSVQFPAHITLSPRETLALYDAMANALSKKDSIKRLSPESYFKEKGFISKQDAKVYEDDLKKEFLRWTSEPKRVEKVIANLRGKMPFNVWPEKGEKYVTKGFRSLLEELDKNDKLPVIFFSFNRHLCETLAQKTVNYLMEKEKTIKAKGSTCKPVKDQEKQARRKAKLQKRFRDNSCNEIDEKMLRKTSSAGHNEDLYKQRRNQEPEQTCFLFDHPHEEGCSFASPGVLDRDDAQAIVGKLEHLSTNMNMSLFKDGLSRGVSYHHAGMSSIQRRVVEMLFRKRFLRVVFATGTLALGIHMPCKTVVFAGDSVFLNSLQYHQISGRAGRRGFDLLGNVIFLGIPEAKIQRLMTVDLPKIIGNFPLSVTLVLRLLLLVNKADDPKAVMNEALTLLQNSLICRDQPELDLQLKHHFLFSVEMLVRQKLLDVKGNPQGLAGLAAHLHYHEPANLVFVSLLQQGLFHDFCRRGRSKGKFSKEFMKSLIVILSHLFAVRKLHPFMLLQKRSTSKLILEELPPEFEKGLAKYNSTVYGVFDLYLRTVAVHVYDTMGEDVTLPLSNFTFISTKCYCSEIVENEPNVTLEAQLANLSLPYKVCSAFAALSGHTDTQLYSCEDLISNIRYQVYTDVKVVPIIQRGDYLNAYAVDFYNHGNYKAITSENGLEHGDAFKLLKDFLLVIKSICVSLTELGPEDGDDVIAAFTQLEKEYSAVFENCF